MSKFDEQYLDLCERILKDGERVVNYTHKTDKRGSASVSMPNHIAQVESESATIRLPHQVLEFDLSEEFPVLTTKFAVFRAAILEMLWIWQVQSNDVRWLQERGVKIWNEWEIDENGDYMGKHFGKEFAHTIGTAYGWIVHKYHLTEDLIETLKNDPGNRRMVLSLWQNEYLKTAALPSCVWSNEWNITNGRVNILVNSRSTDVPLGLPFNITQYATFLCLVAHCLDLKPGRMTFVTNDAHIYENQVEGIREQIRRRDEKLARDGKLFDAPKLWINPEVKDFFKFDNSKKLSDIRLEGYKHQGRLKMEITA
ncbi:thymidylate synthase [Candidatus Saccharibacteria bacterium]|nr:thymidylate synthase [Candidatus Saccharibacteria bacterium]